MNEETVLWFGRHKGQAVASIPSGYLGWLLANVPLSARLRQAVAAELTRRGRTPPPPPPPNPPPPCPRCGGVAYCCGWAEDRTGRRRIHASCAACDKWLCYTAEAEPYRTLADASASPTDLLDVLTACETLGLRLRHLEGGTADWADARSYWAAPPALRAKLRGCRYRLARMLRRDAT
jgi:hypothetical protein